MKKEKEEKWFENWDNVEVRERYHRKREAIEALKAATCVFVQMHSRNATRSLKLAINAAKRAGLTTTEIDAVINATSEEGRRKKEAKK